MRADSKLCPTLLLPSCLLCPPCTDCKTFTTQTFTTPDVHHPLCKIRRSPPQTFTTPDVHHLRHSSPQTFITPCIKSNFHHPFAKMWHSPPPLYDATSPPPIAMLHLPLLSLDGSVEGNWPVWCVGSKRTIDNMSQKNVQGSQKIHPCIDRRSKTIHFRYLFQWIGSWVRIQHFRNFLSWFLGDIYNRFWTKL